MPQARPGPHPVVRGRRRRGPDRRTAWGRRQWVAAVVALGMVVAGCGSNPTASTNPSPAITAARATTVPPPTTLAPTTAPPTTAPLTTAPPTTLTPTTPPPTTPAPTTLPPAPPTPATTASPAGGGSAAGILAALAVKGRAPLTGYSRAEFGPAWADVDRNGCDTRNDILRRDLTDVETVVGDGCTVLRGVLHDPYTGRTIAFVRGVTTSDDVQIDHVVALADAWQKGAQPWESGVRWAFGNDPLNLLAVDGPTNQQKGDGDAATWLPPNKAFRCSYVARQIAVKHKYGLWVTAAERDAMARVLAACPGEGLPAGWDAPVVPYAGTPATPQPTITAPPTLAPAPTPAPGAASAGGVPPIGPYTCPDSAPIKGNEGSNGDIFHLPGGRYYSVTKPEVCFASAAEAEAAGFRASRS